MGLRRAGSSRLEDRQVSWGRILRINLSRLLAIAPPPQLEVAGSNPASATKQENDWAWCNGNIRGLGPRDCWFEPSRPD